MVESGKQVADKNKNADVSNDALPMKDKNSKILHSTKQRQLTNALKEPLNKIGEPFEVRRL